MSRTVKKSFDIKRISTVAIQQIIMINQLNISISMFYFLLDFFINPSLIKILFTGYQNTAKTAKKMDMIKPKITAIVPAPSPGPI